MSLLAKLLGRSARLAPAQRNRLARWRALPEADLSASVADARLIVADIESTGLNLRADRLIAIGAVAVDSGKIDLRHSFYAVLRQPQSSSRENILVHGIGGTAQREGDEPVEALLAFLEFAGKRPLVGYHAAFDEAMIRKATDSYLAEPFCRTWLDLADLAPAVVREVDGKGRTLDFWLDRFGIEAFSRHDAIADAVATAQLMQILLDRAAALGIVTVGALLKHAEAHRWLIQRS